MATSTETVRTVVTAETSQFHSRIAAAGQAIERFSRAPISATRSVALFRSAADQLSIQLLGIRGPAGTAFRALNAFGGPQMLGITATIGAMVLIWRKLGESMREAEAQAKKTADGLAALMAQGRPNVVIQNQLNEVGKQLDEARTRREALGRPRFQTPEANRREIAAVEATIANLEAQQSILKGLLGAARQDILENALLPTVEAEERAVKAMERQVKLANELRQAVLAGVVPGVVGGGVRPGTGGARLIAAMDATDRRLAAKATDPLAPFLETLDMKLLPVLAPTNTAFTRLATSLERSQLLAEQLGPILVSTLGGIIQGLIASRSGGAGGFFGGLLSAAGGIASIGVKGLFAANPLLGAGLTAAGGIVSTIAAKSRRDPIPVYDRAVRAEVHDLRNEIRQVLISATVVDPLGRPLSVLRYEQDRQTRRDANPRLP